MPVAEYLGHVTLLAASSNFHANQHHATQLLRCIDTGVFTVHRLSRSFSSCIVYDVVNFVDYAVASKEPRDVGTEADANVSSSSVYQPVYVSAVEHPEHFWMQMLNERSTQLDTLITEMTSFYETQV